MRRRAELTFVPTIEYRTSEGCELRVARSSPLRTDRLALNGAATRQPLAFGVMSEALSTLDPFKWQASRPTPPVQSRLPDHLADLLSFGKGNEPKRLPSIIIPNCSTFICVRNPRL